MIRFLLLQNRQGKTRLSKWYIPPPEDEEKTRFEEEVNRIILSRDRKYTNFVEHHSHKLIYRRYAGLYFIAGCDVTDNELGMLETIHFLVELLDSYFSNVCELDIVFHFNKVYCILDEYILAGEVAETNKLEILEKVRELERYD
mmetsp:Transcript_11800/g.18137  ORF Transcript_11800/g.18137 Transcript_11800/m.18137 type:complete len:144 (-) Transcript_11800:45-476(-)